jgi:hypothetical protein
MVIKSLTKLFTENKTEETMKLYEFLQKIEDCGQEFAINLCSHNREGFLSRLEIGVYVKDYQFLRKYVERANKKHNERELPEDFIEEWKEIEIFIKKSLAKVAIDEE